jgi:hypothetical protein
VGVVDCEITGRKRARRARMAAADARGPTCQQGLSATGSRRARRRKGSGMRNVGLVGCGAAHGSAVPISATRRASVFKRVIRPVVGWRAGSQIWGRRKPISRPKSTEFGENQLNCKIRI